MLTRRSNMLHAGLFVIWYHILPLRCKYITLCWRTVFKTNSILLYRHIAYNCRIVDTSNSVETKMPLYILCREVRNVATCKVHLYFPDKVIFASSNEIFYKDRQYFRYPSHGTVAEGRIERETFSDLRSWWKGVTTIPAMTTNFIRIRVGLYVASVTLMYSCWQFLFKTWILSIPFNFNPEHYFSSCAGIFKQPVEAKNRVGIGLSYRPTRLHRKAELIPMESIPGLLKSLKIRALGGNYSGEITCSSLSEYYRCTRTRSCKVVLYFSDSYFSIIQYIYSKNIVYALTFPRGGLVHVDSLLFCFTHRVH
jgi:hypothetical protein